jgi:hypothetical protein
LASFVAYTLISRRPLTVSIAFTALGVFSQLQSGMTQLPGHIFAMFHGAYLKHVVRRSVSDEITSVDIHAAY